MLSEDYEKGYCSDSYLYHHRVIGDSNFDMGDKYIFSHLKKYFLTIK